MSGSAPPPLSLNASRIQEILDSIQSNKQQQQQQDSSKSTTTSAATSAPLQERTSWRSPFANTWSPAALDALPPGPPSTSQTDTLKEWNTANPIPEALAHLDLPLDLMQSMSLDTPAEDLPPAKYAAVMAKPKAEEKADADSDLASKGRRNSKPRLSGTFSEGDRDYCPSRNSFDGGEPPSTAALPQGENWSRWASMQEDRPRKLGRPLAFEGDPEDPSLSVEERRAVKRRIANRESARRVRDRRLAGLNKLEDRMAEKERENEWLQERCKAAEDKVAVMEEKVLQVSTALEAVLEEGNCLRAELAHLQKVQEIATNPGPPMMTEPATMDRWSSDALMQLPLFTPGALTDGGHGLCGAANLLPSAIKTAAPPSSSVPLAPAPSGTDGVSKVAQGPPPAGMPSLKPSDASSSATQDAAWDLDALLNQSGSLD